MPKDGNSGSSGDGSKWDSADLKFLNGLVLYLANTTWAQNVYDAIWTKSVFRLIVDGKLVVSLPKGSTVAHASTHTVLWKTKDLEWDDAGCLVIKDKQLGDRILEAHENGEFKIATPGPSGPIGENKVNAMCPC